MSSAGLSIIGAGRGASGGATFAAVNPATGEALPTLFHSALPEDVDRAAQLAGEAFSIYGNWSGAKRAELLDKIAGLLEANAAAIVEIGMQESALPQARLEGELARTCFQLRLYGSAAAKGISTGARIDHGDPDRKPLPKPDLRSMMRPLGPVVVFGASNFPLAFSAAGGDTASALAAGCPVIVKAHSAHPGTAEKVGVLIQQAIAECGAPEGVYSLVFSVGREVANSLVKHPQVKAVGFTGSRAGGRALMDLAAARPEPIPVYAEMSSINPFFVLGGALDAKAADIAAGLHTSFTMGVGQFCTNPGLVFVESGAGADAFIQKLAEVVPTTPQGTMLTAGIHGAYCSGVEKIAAVPGVEQVAAAPSVSGKAAAAVFITDAANFLNSPELNEEVFGPFTLVVKCSSPAEMLTAATALEGQLTATVHALPEELEANRSLIDLLANKSGRVLFGGFPTGVEVAHAMTHGGPYPATSDGRSTSVGTRAIDRFQRPVSYQNFPDAMLPPELQEANPLGIPRLVDGK